MVCFRLIEVVQVVCVLFDVFGFCSLFCVVLVGFEPFIFMLDHFRFCMLCSYVVLDLRCKYVAFSFFQVVRVVKDL